jgi:hypothetical protein
METRTKLDPLIRVSSWWEYCMRYHRRRKSKSPLSRDLWAGVAFPLQGEGIHVVNGLLILRSHRIAIRRGSIEDR